MKAMCSGWGASAAALVVALLGGADAWAQAPSVITRWDSNWGPVYFKGTDASFTGHWEQGAGKGEIKRGSFNATTGRLEFDYHQKWNNRDGKATFKLTDVNTLTGEWSQWPAGTPRPAKPGETGSWALKRHTPLVDLAKRKRIREALDSKLHATWKAIYQRYKEREDARERVSNGQKTALVDLKLAQERIQKLLKDRHDALRVFRDAMIADKADATRLRALLKMLSEREAKLAKALERRTYLTFSPGAGTAEEELKRFLTDV